MRIVRKAWAGAGRVRDRLAGIVARGRCVLALVMAGLALVAGLTAGHATGAARPAGVPAAAFFCGGTDGGVFVAAVAARGNRLRLTVYHDRSGRVLARGSMAATAPAREIETLRTSCDGWDGSALLLTTGRAIRLKAAP